jgi:ubiquinone/menaquinone biosynthesis C-methylase UbiE
MSFPAKTLTPEEAYRLWAPTYDSIDNPLLILEERWLLPKVEALSGCHVLDVGCGTGRWLKHMSSRGAKSLQGVDNSAAMLSIARRSCSPQIMLHQANAISLPIPDESVDLVIASFLLSYVQFLDIFIWEVDRVLRPGGRLLLSDLHPQARARGWQSTFHAQDILYTITTYPYTLDDLRELTKSIGLSIEFCEEPYFGEPESQVFARSGRAELFASTSWIPAIYIAGLRKG